MMDSKVNRDRIVNEFMELVKIDSLSFEESNMKDILMEKLRQLDIDNLYEDDAGEKIGGKSGNVVALLKGAEDISPIILLAHMDTVVPGKGKKPVIQDGIIKTDGTTVLGGDDVGGIVTILEAIRIIKENNISHGDIYIAFTVAEEIGLFGSKNLDLSRINAKYGFIFDHGGDIGAIATIAPAHNTINVSIKGKAVHAGVEPENGVSAIQIAAEAISNMKLGRIDFETTANIGSINGGMATNIVCDKILIKAEARSIDNQKLEIQTNHMKECFEKAALKFGGQVEFSFALMYKSFKVEEHEDIIEILKKAADKIGIQLKLQAMGGGSDTNILNDRGIRSVNLSVGMNKVHTVEEQIAVKDLIKSAEFLVSVIQSIN